MICPANHYFTRKQQIRNCKNFLKTQIIKLSIFVLICVLVASLIQKTTDRTSYTFYYAQNKIVNKHTRGVYPPLDGHVYDVYGCWYIIAKIDNTQINLDIFKKYKLCFQETNRLIIYKSHEQCSNNFNKIIFQWKVFGHNMFISDTKYIQLEEDKIQNKTNNTNDTNNTSDTSDTNNTSNNTTNNETSPNLQSRIQQKSYQQSKQQQIKNQDGITDSTIQTNPNQNKNKKGIITCFNQTDSIIPYIHAFTVWTIRDGMVYLISQALVENVLDISIFVLQKYR